MTQSDGSSVDDTEKEPQNLSSAWWKHRFQETSSSVEVTDESLKESVGEFWTEIPEEYEMPSEDIQVASKTELASLGEPPEEFSRVFEIVDHLHGEIQTIQSPQTEYTAETPIDTVVEQIPRAGTIIVKNLESEGFETLSDLEGTTVSELLEINRVGTETAQRLVDFTQNQITKSREEKPKNNRRSTRDDTQLKEIVDQISGFGDVSRKKIEKSGYETAGDVRAATCEELADIEQIGEGTISKLIEYLEIRTENSVSTPEEDQLDDTPVEDFAADVPRVGRVLVTKLNQAGYKTVGDLRTASIDELTDVEHIGQSKAELLLQHANPDGSIK